MKTLRFFYHSIQVITIMKIKSGLGSAALLFAGMASAFSAPLVSIGDKLDIFFNGSVTGRYESNVFLNEATKTSDYSFIISPGIEIQYGRNTATTVSFIFREDIIQYVDNSNLNTNLSNVFLNAAHQGGRSTISADFSYRQLSQNSQNINVVGDLVRRNKLETGVLYAYNISPKTDVELGFRYQYEHFVNFQNLFNDRAIYTVPLDIYYKVTPKIEVGLAYQFRYTDVDDTALIVGNNRTDNFFGVAVRGELAPKLTARIHAGATHRSVQNQPSDTTFTTRGTLLYELTQKVLLRGSFNRDFLTGGSAQNILNTGGSLGVVYNYSEFISSDAFVSYTNSDYLNSPRDDDTYGAGVTVSYTPNAYLRFSAGYVYQNNASNTLGASYMANIVNLTASLRY
jgi:hypothetical protein